MTDRNSSNTSEKTLCPLHVRNGLSVVFFRGNEIQRKCLQWAGAAAAGPPQDVDKLVSNQGNQRSLKPPPPFMAAFMNKNAKMLFAGQKNRKKRKSFSKCCDETRVAASDPIRMTTRSGMRRSASPWINHERHEKIQSRRAGVRQPPDFLFGEYRLPVV